MLQGAGGAARDAGARHRDGAGDNAHAAIAAGAEEIEQATELQRELAGEEGFEVRLGVGVREGDPPILGGVARGQGEGAGGVPAAEEDCEEGEEGPENGVQAHFSCRARGAGLGRALRPNGGDNLHLVSLHR